MRGYTRPDFAAFAIRRDGMRWLNRAILAGLFLSTTVLVASPEELTVASAPPVVVSTEPRAGQTDVAPGTNEIRVTFSRPMRDGRLPPSTHHARAWQASENPVQTAMRRPMHRGPDAPGPPVLTSPTSSICSGMARASSVIHLDPEIANNALELRVPEE